MLENQEGFVRLCGPYTFLSLMILKKNLLYFTTIALCLHKNSITELYRPAPGFVSTPAAEELNSSSRTYTEGRNLRTNNSTWATLPWYKYIHLVKYNRLAPFITFTHVSAYISFYCDCWKIHSAMPPLLWSLLSVRITITALLFFTPKPRALQAPTRRTFLRHVPWGMTSQHSRTNYSD